MKPENHHQHTFFSFFKFFFGFGILLLIAFAAPILIGRYVGHVWGFFLATLITIGYLFLGIHQTMATSTRVIWIIGLIYMLFVAGFQLAQILGAGQPMSKRHDEDLLTSGTNQLRDPCEGRPLGHWPKPMWENYHSQLASAHGMLLVVVLYFTLFAAPVAAVWSYANGAFCSAAIKQCFVYVAGWVLIVAAGSVDPTTFTEWLLD